MTTGHASAPRIAQTSLPHVTATAPLSGSQQAIWVMDRLSRDSGAYNVHFAARVRTSLDLDVLGRAVERLGERHEMLRTTCVELGGTPVQQVHAQLPVSVEVVRIEALDDDRSRALIRAEVRRPLDIERGPAWRVVVLEPAAPEQPRGLLVIAHHLLVDLRGMCTIVDELGTIYSALLVGRQPALPELAWTYLDYVHWHRALLEGPQGQQMLQRWAERLGGELPVLDLPLDHPRPAVTRLEGDRVAFRLPARAPARVSSLALAHRASPLMVLMAAFHAVLHRYSGQRELVVGTPETGRRGSRDWQPVVGNFMNMLPIRVEVDPAQSFTALLGRVCDAVGHARANQEYPFAQLVQALGLARGDGRSPVFQAMLTLQRTPPRLAGLSAFCVHVDEPVTLRLGDDLELEPLDVSQQEGVLDLSLELVEHGGEYHAELKYATALLDRDTVNAMAEAYCALLEAVLHDPSQPVEALPVLSPAERRRVLAAAEGPARVLAETVVERFVAQAARSPEAIAVREGARTLRYAELERRSSLVAAELRRRGVGPDTVVALCMERGIELVVSILGVLRAGGAYLAVDQQQPPARVAVMLEQSRAQGVLVATSTSTPLLELVRTLAPATWVLDVERVLAQAEGAPTPLLPEIAGGDLAYVVFTSGSTGTPKGAMVEHHGMLNHLLAKNEALALGEGDVVAQTAPQSFVIANWQLLAGLLVGATIDVVDHETARDPVALLEHVRNHAVSVLQVVPSLLRVLLDDIETRGPAAAPLTSLRWIVPTGEALAADLCRRWLRLHPSIPLLNAFGCSETSDDVAHYVIAEAPAEGLARVPIGHPVPGSSMHVLDGRGEPVADGMPGELWIGGVAVGRGYLGDEERTRERFESMPAQPSARFYRSGDVVRRRGDGRVEYLGRADHQVKVRGVRIELGRSSRCCVATLACATQPWSRCVTRRTLRLVWWPTWSHSPRRPRAARRSTPPSCAPSWPRACPSR